MTSLTGPPEPDRAAASNPPGQTAVQWRVAPHSAGLRRLRARLGKDPQLAVRALALRSNDDPSIALLDAWALVGDAVSFYTERIAQEGFLRTATELGSVRQLARTLGYELRPGVAAAADLAFTVDDGTSPGGEVRIAAGTAVRTVPGQGQQPQTFETGEDLLARAVWNSISGVETERQAFGTSGARIWLRGMGLGLRRGDLLLLAGSRRLKAGLIPPDQAPDPAGRNSWDLRVIDELTENPPGFTGWTTVEQHSVRPADPTVDSGADSGLDQETTVFSFAERANLVGWHPLPIPAPVRESPALTVEGSADAAEVRRALVAQDSREIPLDGDHPRLHGGTATDPGRASWLVLQSVTYAQVFRVLAAALQTPPEGSPSVRVTRVDVDIPLHRPAFDARGTIVLCQSVTLPAASRPRVAPVTGARLDLVATDPELLPGRRVLVTGRSADSGDQVSDAFVVHSCERADDAAMIVTLDRPLPAPIDPQTLRVLANTVVATHGETVQQVLGSGDGAARSQRFSPARTPMTYVGAAGPSGAASTLRVSVDDVTWDEVPALAEARPQDRVFAIEHGDDGAVQVVLGDGSHGARAATGAENIAATYRVGIGANGAAAPGQLTQLPRRALGVRAVINPGAAGDWADPERLEQARRNAPLRIRTLDRAVSVADHGDFAAAFAGVGQARADQVWDGRNDLVTVSLLATGGLAVGDELLARLGSAMAAARDPATPLLLLPGEQLWFGIRVELRLDPAYQRSLVEAAVRDLLATKLAPGVLPFGTAVTAARALVWVRSVPGVLACTMPRLLPLAAPPVSSAEGPSSLPGDAVATGILGALPARFEDGAVLTAQLLGLPPGAVDLGVMGP